MKNINDNGETYFAVLMNRMRVDRGIYLFKPEYLIEGTVIRENKEIHFTDTMENEYLTIYDTEILSADEETAVGYIISDEELLNKYPNLSIPEAKIEYFDSICNMAHFGFYNIFEDKIAVIQSDLLTMAETLNCMNVLPNTNIMKIPFNDLMQTEINDNDNSKEVLSDATDEFGGQELITISKEIFKNLQEAKTFEEIKKTLDIIKEDYESINLSFIDVNDELKKSNVSKNITSDMLLGKKLTGKHIIDLFDASCEAILEINDIDELKNLINQMIFIYTDISLIFDDFLKNGHNIGIAQDCIYALVDNYEAILKLKDMNLIKKECEKINTMQFFNIKKISDIYDEFNNKKELIQSESVYQDKQKELIQPESTYQDKQKALVNAFANVQNKNISTFDYSKVYTQMIERIIGRDKQIGSILTAIDRMDMSIGTGKKYAVLVAGTTGTGKTQTFYELKKAMPNRPIVIVDTNQLTQEGYVGGTIEKNVLGVLLSEAQVINNKGSKNFDIISKADIELAEKGIIIFDEIDKRAEKNSNDNVNCGAVINQLLKFMDGTTYIVEINKREFVINTENIGVMASGAFQEYFEKKEKNNVCLGFNPVKDQIADEFKKYFEVKPEDLVKYGLANQFIGRFQSVILYPPHTLESLIELETTEATSNLEVDRKYFESKDIELVWEEDFIIEAAKEAIKLKTGGRGLSNIISRCICNVGDEINKHIEEYKIVFLPKEAVKDPGKVMLLKTFGGHILMEEVIERNIEEAKKVRNLKQINPNQVILQKVLKYRSKLYKEESIGMEIVSDPSKVKQKGKS